jgi:hypothetical protein
MILLELALFCWIIPATLGGLLVIVKPAGHVPGINQERRL